MVSKIRVISDFCLPNLSIVKSILRLSASDQLEPIMDIIINTVIMAAVETSLS
jgi:hypothetical protein